MREGGRHTRKLTNTHLNRHTQCSRGARFRPSSFPLSSHHVCVYVHAFVVVVQENSNTDMCIAVTMLSLRGGGADGSVVPRAMCRLTAALARNTVLRKLTCVDCITVYFLL